MFLRRRLFLLCSAAAVAGVLAMAPAALAETNCGAGEPVGNGYTLSVCLTVPETGGTITAARPTITANPEISGGSGPRPRIQRMIFRLTGQGDDDNRLFTDFTRAANGNYAFVFPRMSYAAAVNETFNVRAMMTGASSETSVLASVVASFAGTRQKLDPGFTFAPRPGRAPAAGRPFVVAATGDGAGGEPSGQRVLSLIRSWNPNLFLYTGDVYNYGTQAEYYNHYGLPGRLWGTLRGITNPTIGNHESFYKPDDPGRPGDQAGFGYYNYWGLNENVAASHHYSVDARRGWHIVSLDSTRSYLGPNGGNNPEASNQLDFLRTDLNANRTGCSLVFYHHPRYSVGDEFDNPEDVNRLGPIWRALASRGVDIVLNGHDHNYQHWKRLNANGRVRGNGTAEFVVGTGGHGVRPPIRRDGRTVRVLGREGTFGALRLVLNRHGAEYRYVTVGGRIRDIGVIPCSGRRADRLDNTRPTRPTNLRASKNGRRVTLRWFASTDVNGVGVTAYRVFRNGNYIGTTRRQSFTKRAPQGLNRYYVRAVDYSRNVSFRSNIDRVRIR